MRHWRNTLVDLLANHRKLRSRRSRGPRRIDLSWESLEGRVTPAHISATAHLAAAVHAHAHAHAHPATRATTRLHSTSTTSATVAATSSTRAISAALTSTPSLPGTSTTSTSSTGTSTTSCDHGTPNSTLSTALQTLRADIQSIELNSGTTVGQLTAIRVAFQRLATDGLTPSSNSALQSFENSLVTTNATTPGSLTGDTTLQSQFAALYTSSPTMQQTTDLNAAYDAMAAAVTSAGITSANITTIDTDWSAVLAVEGSTSTATFPYFTLVTGQGGRDGFGLGGHC